MAYVNFPTSFESFILKPGERKITYTKDQKQPNSGTFSILKEDHTLGNLLRMKLLADERVLFCGYKVPHPLTYEVIVKVRTRAGCPEPEEVFNENLKQLDSELSSIERRFQRAVDAFQKENNMLDDGNVDQQDNMMGDYDDYM